MINGSPCSSAWSVARVIFSPTTLPMLPARNEKSMTHTTTLRPFTNPVPEIRPSGWPLDRCAALMRSG